MGENFQSKDRDQQVDQEVFVTSSATVVTKALKIHEKHLRIILSNGNNMAVTLPPVAEAKGLWFFISVMTDGGASASVADAGDAASAISHTMADAHDRGAYYSDGLYWHSFATGV